MKNIFEKIKNKVDSLPMFWWTMIYAAVVTAMSVLIIAAIAGVVLIISLILNSFPLIIASPLIVFMFS